MLKVQVAKDIGFCFGVDKAIQIAKDLLARGENVYVTGELIDKHDEVVFLKSVVKDLKVFDSKENVKYDTKKIAVFSQTTMDTDGFREISKAIVEDIGNLSTVMIKNSICNVTYQREREVKRLASENDVCLVIGSDKSSNTKKLFNISKSINYKTYLVLSMVDLKPEWFDSARSVGICSGTSTSMRIVNEIVERLRMFKN